MKMLLFSICTTFVIQIFHSLSRTVAPLNQQPPTSWESVLHIRNDFQSQLGKWVTAAAPAKMLPLAVFFSLDLSDLKGLGKNEDVLVTVLVSYNEYHHQRYHF